MNNPSLSLRNALVARSPQSFDLGRNPSFASLNQVDHILSMPHRHTKKARVCTVDDEPAVRCCLAELFRKSPEFKFCGGFGTAKEALARIPALNPDIVLMDIRMAHISGIECMQRLKAQMPGLKVIMLSGLTDPEITRRALTGGADGYLVKPFEFEELTLAMQFALKGGTPLSAGISSRVIESTPTNIGDDKALQLLTEREREVALHLAQGLQYKEIADRLGISAATVTQHLHHIYEKLHVQNKIEALNRIFPHGYPKG